jgi:hypothetical protein
MPMEIQILAWDTYRNVERLNWLMGSQWSSFLNNWIFNGKTDINKHQKFALYVL